MRLVRPGEFVGDDRALLAAIQEGRPDGKAALFDRYEGHVRRIIVRVVGPNVELGDALHDVFVNVYRSIHTVRDPSTLRPWLTQVTIFTARKLIRSKRRRAWLHLFTSDEEESQYEPESSVDAQAVYALREAYRILDTLPEGERLAFTLRFVEAMALNEVADACQVSLATTKRRIQRAQEKFMAVAADHPVLSDWMKGQGT